MSGARRTEGIDRRRLLRGAGAALAAPPIGRFLWTREDAATPAAPHHAPRARALIHLHMAGAPSQMDLFDPKPVLAGRDGEPCPDALLEGKRFAFIHGRPVLLGSPFAFRRHGASGAWLSELLPHLATVADEVAFVRSMRTEEFNHAPAQLLLGSGSPRFGRPGIGAWLSWALGPTGGFLPAYVVLVSGGRVPSAGASLWSAGFLPSAHQGVEFRSGGSPVLFLDDPPGTRRADRRRLLDALHDLNELAHARHGDPETTSRSQQYELAHHMQTAVPAAVDLSLEPAAVLEGYGATPGAAGFAEHCLLARRLVEDGVRIVQLYDWGWDHHGSGEHDDLTVNLPRKCAAVDRPVAALVADLRSRGMLDETLVLWTGEFGRTPMRENRNDAGFVGRDHHGDGFTVWMAGGGARPGVTYGATDELGAEVAEDPVEVFDLQATLLHLFGFDHERLTYPFQGRDFRLTDVAGRVIPELVA